MAGTVGHKATFINNCGCSEQDANKLTASLPSVVSIDQIAQLADAGFKCEEMKSLLGAIESKDNKKIKELLTANKRYQHDWSHIAGLDNAIKSNEPAAIIAAILVMLNRPLPSDPSFVPDKPSHLEK